MSSKLSQALLLFSVTGMVGIILLLWWSSMVRIILLLFLCHALPGRRHLYLCLANACMGRGLAHGAGAAGIPLEIFDSCRQHSDRLCYIPCFFALVLPARWTFRCVVSELTLMACLPYYSAGRCRLPATAGWSAVLILRVREHLPHIQPVCMFP